MTEGGRDRLALLRYACNGEQDVILSGVKRNEGPREKIREMWQLMRERVSRPVPKSSISQPIFLTENMVSR